MSVFDVSVLIAVIGAAFGGFRAGFCRRALGGLGIVAGFVVGAQMAPLLATAAASGGRAALAAAASATVVGALALGRWIGSFLGASLRTTFRPGFGRSVDGVLGALLGGSVVVIATWFVVPVLRSGGAYTSDLVEGSRLVALIESGAPVAPAPLEVVRAIGGGQRWAELLVELEPQPLRPPEGVVVTAEVVEIALAATVKVERSACHRLQEGTGFVIGRVGDVQLVLTNAHVVAGTTTGSIPLTVRSADRNVRAEARVVTFDPVRDIAVLAVEDHALPSLALASAPAVAGAVGQLYGHPGGSSEAVARPFRVDAIANDLLPDIYGEPLDLASPRPVLVVAASIERGDSGSPLVTDGGVVGMAFALTVPEDPDAAGVALAVPLDDLVTAVERARGDLVRDPSLTASTGPCVVGP